MLFILVAEIDGNFSILYSNTKFELQTRKAIHETKKETILNAESVSERRRCLLPPLVFIQKPPFPSINKSSAGDTENTFRSRSKKFEHFKQKFLNCYRSLNIRNLLKIKWNSCGHISLLKSNHQLNKRFLYKKRFIQITKKNSEESEFLLIINTSHCRVCMCI